MSWTEVDEVTVDPLQVRVYAEGWQSWSPTTWTRPGTHHRPDQPWQHTMRFRPGVPLADDGWQGEGLLVVDPGNGEEARCYAAAEAIDDVPTVRARLVGDRLVVSASGAVTASRHGDPVAALEDFGSSFAADVAPLRSPPRVWCSWYRYFEEVTASDVTENLRALDDLGLPVDVVQIDDGWSRGLGEGLEPSPGFGSLPGLVDSIRATGRRAGIWLAPFFVGEETTLAREHPEWQLGDAGANWGQPLQGLDLTHPAVRELLFSHVTRLRELGVDYFKLDFLYAGAIPGLRHEDRSPVSAYRSGMQLLREAAGDEAYFVGCGAPILPSVGLVDAMRVSPDTFHEGGEDGSTGLRGRMSLVGRAWQQGRFWVNDPDCLVVRPSYSQREPWAETFENFGGLRSCSDRLTELDPWGLDVTRRLLSSPVPPEPFDRAVLTAAWQEAS